MDRIESLTNTLSNITLYDIKSMYTQAKNVVLNISEMEAKVREATNDDPWGASSTLMQEIAQGTFHFQYFNEVMPSIYSRFMEKEARQWRQIYKALQLLEYLIKHGSERVVDDARSHISTLKMLRNFHYIDEKGKDEGVNVRNRARELVELLSDVEKIRAERRKAKANKSKYVGTGNDGMGFGGMSFESSGGGRYGGFGTDNLNSTYGNGGGSSSRIGGSSSFSDNRRQYEEYNAGEDEMAHTPSRSNSVRNPARKSSTATTTVAPPSQPDVDLLGGLDDDTQTAPTTQANRRLSTNKALPVVSNAVTLDDDDFADFQAAPVQPTQTTATAAPTKKPTLMDMLGPGPTAPSIGAQQQQHLGYGIGIATQGVGMGAGGHRQMPSFSAGPTQFATLAAQPPPMQNLFAGNAAQLRPTPMASGSSISLPGTSATPSVAKSSAPAAKSSSNFDDLWNLSLGSKPANAVGAGGDIGKSIKDLEKEKAMAGLWGRAVQPKASSTGVASQQVFSSFGNAPPPSSTDGDDLLL